MIVCLIPVNLDIRKQVKFPEILICPQNEIIPNWFCILDTTSMDILFTYISPQLNITLKILKTKIKYFFASSQESELHGVGACTRDRLDSI